MRGGGRLAVRFLSFVSARSTSALSGLVGRSTGYAMDLRFRSVWASTIV